MIAVAAVAALIIPLRNMLSVDPSSLFAAVFSAIVVGWSRLCVLRLFIGFAFASGSSRTLCDPTARRQLIVTIIAIGARKPRARHASYDGEPRCDRATTESTVYESDRQ